MRACVPDVELAGVRPKRRIVLAIVRAPRRKTFVARVVELQCSSGYFEAGSQPLDVPLEWPRRGLVEVVDVEDKLRARATQSRQNFDRWASPQSWTRDPCLSVGRSAAMGSAAPRK